MLRKPVISFLLVLMTVAPAVLSAQTASPAKLSAEEIVEKNVAARGGLQAWRAVHTMSMTGTMGAGGNQRATLAVPTQDPKGRMPIVPPRPAVETRLPFTMYLARPRKQRLEIQFKGQTAIQVYDGSNGWKLRPYLNRRVVEPYTADEVKSAANQAELDGPLVDYAAKGTKVELIGTEKVENRDTYKLKLTMKDGHSLSVWIDAQTFLETKIEGQPRRLDGLMHPVEIYYRDYRQVGGLKVPYVLETQVLPVNQTVIGMKEPPVPAEQIILDKVELNPQFEAPLFSKPQA